jgi:hypothetical protein
MPYFGYLTQFPEKNVPVWNICLLVMFVVYLCPPSGQSIVNKTGLMLIILKTSLL